MKSYDQENYVESSLKETLELLRKYVSEEELGSHLNTLKSKIKSKSLDRYLIEIFPYTLSKRERVRIITLLGDIGSERAFSFLTQIIEKEKDAPLIRSAIFSLSNSDKLCGLEFLANKLTEKNSVFLREILISLSKNPLFFLTKTLEKLLANKDLDSSLKMQISITFGHRLTHSSFYFLFDRMKETFMNEPALFNATLLAAGRIAKKEDLENLQIFAKDERFFVRELLEYVTERVHSRENLSLDAVLKNLLEEEIFSATFKKLLTSLKVFQKEDVLKKFKTLENSNKNLETKAFIHLNYLEDSLSKDTFLFFKKNIETLSPLVLSYFIRFLNELEEKEKIEEVLDNLDVKKTLEILSAVGFKGSFSYLVKMLSQKKTSPQDQIEIINTLILQKTMGYILQDSLDSLAFLFFENLKKEKDESLRNRLLRALSEIGKAKNEHLSTVVKFFSAKQLNLGSYLVFLRALNSKESDEILSELLHNFIKSQNNASIRQVFKILIEDKKSLPASVFKIPKSLQTEFPLLLLKLLSDYPLEHFDSFIEEKLNSEYLDEVLLSLKAFQKRPIKNSWKKVCDLAENSSSEIIQLHALQAICTEGSQVEQKIALRLILSEKLPRETLLTVLRVLKPADGNQKENFIEEFEQAIEKKSIFTEDEEVEAAAFSLRDRMEAAAEGERKNLLSEEKTHVLDKKIIGELPAYSLFTANIKSVLRNAELTWERKDLFDSLVDKSTMVIEYTKSLELLIQQKIGGPLFKDPAKTNTALQQRLLLLGLSDDYTSTKKFLEILNCFDLFSEKNFPRHRAQGIVTSILGGHFSYEYHRILDSIRSWALMFLIFFRDFDSHEKSFKSLLKLNDSSHKNIIDLSYSLNNLQEIRNNAAHRGTLFNLARIESIRKETFSLLKKIHAL
jgi:hypothetical protein